MRCFRSNRAAGHAPGPARPDAPSLYRTTRSYSLCKVLLRRCLDKLLPTASPTLPHSTSSLSHPAPTASPWAMILAHRQPVNPPFTPYFRRFAARASSASFTSLGWAVLAAHTDCHHHRPQSAPGHTYDIPTSWQALELGSSRTREHVEQRSTRLVGRPARVELAYWSIHMAIKPWLHDYNLGTSYTCGAGVSVIRLS